MDCQQVDNGHLILSRWREPGNLCVFGILVQDRVEKDSRAYQNARLGIVFGIIGLSLWVFTLLTMNYLNIDVNSLFGGSPQEPLAF